MNRDAGDALLLIGPHGPPQHVLPRPQLDPRHLRQRIHRRRRLGCDPGHKIKIAHCYQDFVCCS